MPIEIYYQLVQRIIILSDKPVIIDNDETNWDNYIALDVGFRL